MSTPSDPWGTPPEPQNGPSPSQWVQPWGQPQSGQPQYGQPQQPQYGQPQQPQQPQYGQPQYGQPQQSQYGQPQYGQPASPPARTAKTKALVAASVAVVLIAGAVISFVAFRDKSTGAGASTPQAAVKSVVDDLTKSDILGVLDHLPPGERNALRDSFTNQVNQLKRLKVLDQSADPGKVAGVEIKSTGLTFESSDDVVNDRVRVVKVTGGTITLNSDASRIPYTKEFLDAAFPDGNAPSGTDSDTVDIAKEVADSGEPVRIAVQKVSGKWYPSLMYTLIDSINRENNNSNPTASDAIPAAGESSPEEAARALIEAAATSDATKAIAVLDPDDSAALHDYGKLLAQDTASNDPSYQVDDIEFKTTKVSGGTRVSITGLTVTDTEEDSQVKFAIDGDCVNVESDGDSDRYCAADVFDEFADDIDLTTTEKSALTNLFKALPNIGVIATESGGKWFISPLRTYTDLGTAVLSGLGQNDLITLIKLVNKQR